MSDEDVSRAIDKDAETAAVEQEAVDDDGQAPEDQLTMVANSFLLKLDALLETVNRIMLIVLKSRERAIDERRKFIRSLTADGAGDEDPVSIDVGSVLHRDYIKLDSAADKAVEAARIVPQSFLVSMVSQYDVFLSSSIRNLFLLKPEKTFSAEKSVTVQQLVRYSSVREVVQELIDSEIDEVLRDSHLKQLQWTAKKFDFKLDEKDELIQRFIEITERRNLCVHTEGRISKQYCSKVALLESGEPSQAKVGAYLNINRSYISQARNVLFQTGIQVVQLAWRKVRPDQAEAQNGHLIGIVFELLTREDYTLARNISDFAASLRGPCTERQKRTFCINRAQAYKWSGKDAEAEKILNEVDWSASSNMFRLAVALIKEDYEVAARLMGNVPDDSLEGIAKESYRTWPLFKRARDQSAFQAAFKAKFGESLILEKIDVSSRTSSEEEAPPGKGPSKGLVN